MDATREASNAGGRFFCARNAAGRATLNASSRSGNPTRSHVPRYRRALTGRSSEPGRDRRRSGAGEAAVTAFSLGLDSERPFSRGNDGVRSLGARGTGEAGE